MYRRHLFRYRQVYICTWSSVNWTEIHLSSAWYISHTSPQTQDKLCNLFFYYFLPATKVSKVSISITFKRRWGYYIIQIYVPSIFLVVLSWLAFFMESSDISDRLALEVTMILSIVFLLGGVNTSLPHVSYAKASDWFVIVSFAFVFMALLETMLVYRLTSWNTSSQSENQRNCFVSFLYKLKLRVGIICILYGI